MNCTYQIILRPLKIHYMIASDLLEHRNIGAQNRKTLPACFNQRKAEAFAGRCLEKNICLKVSFSQGRIRRVFQDEEALSMGVDIRRKKYLLIILTTLLTGVTVAFTGTIGFIDLVAPHVVRRMFGARHRVVIPMSFLYGGAFMSLADLLARTLISPREIPVGAVTALLGAPFFVFLFLRKKKA